MVEIEDTYCEAFDGMFSRILITARDNKRLMRAACSATALPSTVFGRSEGGIEKWLDVGETPDGRKGAVIQIWVNAGKKAKDNLERELGWRIRQGVLVVPTTSVFNALVSDEKIDVAVRVGRCGDGYEYVESHCGREVINIPIMMPVFRIERYLGCKLESIMDELIQQSTWAVFPARSHPFTGRRLLTLIPIARPPLTVQFNRFFRQCSLPYSRDSRKNLMR